MGFVGSDKIDEAQLGCRYNNLSDQIIADAGCSLVVASNDEYERPISRNARIATSYPNLTRWWLNGSIWASPGPKIVEVPSGSVEAYVKLGVADTIVDIRESGQTLDDNSLSYFREIEPITTRLVWRSGEYEPELNVDRLYEALRGIERRKIPVGYFRERRHVIGATTTQLLYNSRNELVKKLSSEMGEFVQALVLESENGLVNEGQDVLYAIAVALSSADRSLIESLNKL